ncbi:Leucine Rich repeat [Mactra antiquata]
MADFDGLGSRESTPHLPPIHLRYDTPGSDYMTGFTDDQTKMIGKNEYYTDTSARGKTTDRTSTISGRSHGGYSSYTGGSKSTDRRLQEPVTGPVKSATLPGKSKTNIDRLKPDPHRAVRDHTMPFVQDKSRKVKHYAIKSYTDIPYTTIPQRKSSITSSDVSYAYRRKRSSAKSIKENRLESWDPPVISQKCYTSAKEHLLTEGKFKGVMAKYFGVEKKWWEEKSDSEDDGYDTDLDPHIGFHLISDEKTREILDNGPFPEYKQECRKFRSNPNSYFLRHCLDDDMEMKHRYLSKPDSITMSNFIKNHLTLNTLNIEDNGIGPNGMKYFTECLRENKYLTEMYIAGNNLGPLGAKYLRSSLVSNCFLTKIDVSDNNLSERGGKCIAAILEENVTLKDLNISGNNIGDVGITDISKALGNNISLKVIDVSWNNIQTSGALSLCTALKKNTELEVFLASMNGFAKEGGLGMMSVLRENNILTEIDLSSNRIPDHVVKNFTNSLNDITSLRKINLANNLFTAKPVTDLLVSLMARPCNIKEVNLEGVFVAEDFKGLSKALGSAHGITIYYSEQPSRRNVSLDILTKNLKILSEFMEAEEIEVEDLFPDYEDDEEDDPCMITIKEALVALEYCGKITNTDKLQKLKSNIRYGKRRKFFVSEFAKVYDTVNCGHDPMEEQPLRSHLRRSIKAEREAAERKAAQQSKRRSVFS